MKSSFAMCAVVLLTPVLARAQAPGAQNAERPATPGPLGGASRPTNLVKYHVTMNDVKYVYGVAAPVARLKSGDFLDTNTVDAFGNAIQKPGDSLSLVKGDNPLTGPFYIDGAAPGDTLAVKVISVDVDSNQGVGALAPGFGALNPTGYTPMISPGVPEKIWLYPIDHASNTATFHALDSKFSVKIPLHPFLGCIGVAPAGGEARSSVVPAEFGGNMDAPEVSAGNTLYLPVNVAGALLYLGDGHAAMGDGEVAGTAIEVPLRVRLQVSVIKGKTIAWPRFENDQEIMAVGAYRPLDDALRIAFSEMVNWMEADYGFSKLDAYELLSKVAEIHLTEMVDPNYVVIAKINKKYLPPRPPAKPTVQPAG
ncbi:MAG: acetamidase [Acidipila sp.]|nr:acetamidase [Acidipila sp.]